MVDKVDEGNTLAPSLISWIDTTMVRMSNSNYSINTTQIFYNMGVFMKNMGDVIGSMVIMNYSIPLIHRIMHQLR